MWWEHFELDANSDNNKILRQTLTIAPPTAYIPEAERRFHEFKRAFELTFGKTSRSAAIQSSSRQNEKPDT